VDDLLSEKEQIEQMRSWWSDYGRYVIAGVVLGGSVLFGINYYQSSKAAAELEASTLYDELTNEVVDEDLDMAEIVTRRLQSDHAESAYTAQAMLAMARLYMDINRDQDAASMLNDLLVGAADDEFKKVARLRLAKLYLYQDKPDEALALLASESEDAAFSARYADAMGDAYVALGRIDEARDAYERALSEPNQQATINQSFVQLKLLDLPIEEIAAAGDAREPAVDAGAESADATEAAADATVEDAE
jgi:predicted negative regulator of RcsB-dependent stress response